ncbi:MAG: TonB-dependent receptor [Usitatibacter sp.]
MVRIGLVALAAILAAIPRAAAPADNPAEAVELSRIEVIGTTPLPGLGVPLSRVPANVQVFSPGLRDRTASLPDFLDRNAASANASSGQGNPFQPDFAYRGFAASPLLGLPQGLGVFQDGVRVNEPFGDVVNWDLIPGSAIGSIQLIPGTTPVFGPNTLGGALAIYTKSGAQFPGGSLESYTGSFARRALELEQGGSDGPWDYFFTGNLARDAGWAAHNPSRIGQFFGKVGYQTDRADIDLSVTLADNRLEGNQALPRSFLDDIRQPYTWPDRNVNQAALVALKGSHFVGDGILLGGTAYTRRYRNENLSSNVDADSIATNGNQATNDRAQIDQWGYGLGVQLTLAGNAVGHDNQLVVGASADFGDARFSRQTQPARFTPSRGTEGLGEFSPTTDASTSSGHYGAFLADTFTASEHWVFTVSARHDLARVGIDDRSGQEPRLDGRHRFSRLNPAAGANFIPSPWLTAYVGYSEGMRAPTPIELTCADASAPCKLPNNFLADPPLLAVVARTVEAGARGKWGGGSWSAAAFRTALSNDIQFVSSGEGAPNAGYFRNVGATRRQGIELTAASKREPWDVALRYSFVDATFRTSFLERSPNNSSADASGDILVVPGNRIPGIPRQSFKLSADYGPDEAWALGMSARCASAVVARGDENNRDVNGAIPGYCVVDLHGRWRLAPNADIFAFVDNLLDKRYAGAGLLGRNFFSGPGHGFAPDDAAAEQFRGMGAPFGAWIGVRYQWR